MTFSWMKPSAKHRATRSKTPPRPRPQLELLEDRLAPAVVNTIADIGTNENPGRGSLRAAIMAVNSGTDNTITFNIAQLEIDLTTSALLPITHKVTINGANAMPGVAGNVTINGHLAGNNAVGLTLGRNAGGTDSADGSTIVNLTIDQFTGDGLLLNNVANVQIGSATQAGVVVNQNSGNGVHITGDQATKDQITHSIIGTDANSSPNLGNAQNGVLIDDHAFGNIIGLSIDPKFLNVISGQNGANKAGVSIHDSSGNSLDGNFIGTDVTGMQNLGNYYGVSIDGTSRRNFVGTLAKISKDGKNAILTPDNLISGNSAGVVITGTAATLNYVRGNYLGVDITGKASLSNLSFGVLLSGTTGNTIGGGASDEANLISGVASLDGIRVVGGSTGNTIQGNDIGTGSDPTDPNVQLGAALYGISFDSTSLRNTVKGNTIKFNGLLQNGDAVDDPGKGNKVSKNGIFHNGAGIIDGAPASAPVLVTAQVTGTTLLVQGTLVSTPNATFSLEFFGNSVADAVGHEQGEFYLGTATVTTDANGFATIQASFNAVYGVAVSATATGVAADGFTSQFSNEVQIAGASSTAAVGGFVWNDVNGNGLQDSGETGAPGLQVQLFDPNNTLIAATATDNTGHYLFSNLLAGQYYVHFTAPSGIPFTRSYQGDSTIDSHADPTTGNSEVFSLIAGEVDPYYGAGLFQPATSTSLASSANPAVAGQSVTFTATVADSFGGTPTGTVTFMDGQTVLGTATLAAGQGGARATFATSALSSGSHSITAVYAGDGTFNASTSSILTQTVYQRMTTTSVSSSADPSAPGQAVTFTATVAASGGAPTGTVTFMDGQTVLGTATVDGSGHAAFTTSGLSAGSHSITAVYGGDGGDAGSTSSTLTQYVQLAPTFTSLSSSVNPSPFGQPVTFTASVMSNLPPTGTVSFFDGGVLLGTASLSGRSAIFTTSSLSRGSHSLTAVYSGDANDAGSTSSVLTETVL